MKRCPTCNRTYTDESLLFCADDGTQLVTEAAPAEPFNAPPSSQPTIAFTPSPPASSYQPTPKKKKWLAVIALVLGLFALPFLLYSLVSLFIWGPGVFASRLDLILLGPWGAITLIGILFTIVSVIAALIALVLSLKNPARYGGRLVAVAGPVLTVLLVVLVIGVFVVRRTQALNSIYTFDSNRNYNSNDNSNYNWNRSNNDNLASNSNSSSTASNSADESDDSTDMSETDKYRLFYAAAKSGDTSLQQRAAKKVGIVDSGGVPTSTYQSFTKGMINWAFTDSAWVQTMDTPAKARAYAEERL